MTGPPCPAESQVLILAPTGRDAPLAHAALHQAGMPGEIVASIDVLVARLQSGAAALLVAHEALAGDGIRRLATAIGDQPTWSDLPVVVMLSARAPGNHVFHALSPLADLGSVTFLERPMAIPTLVAAMRFAVRSRARQYALRDLLVQRERDAAELARSNEDLERFAAVVSHDLQEPLRMVTAYGALLTRRYADRLDDAGRSFLGFMTDGALRMRRMITAFLDYAKAGRAIATTGTFDLGDALDDAIRNLARAIAERGATVTADGPLPTARGDRGLVAQVLQNLIGNAVRYATAVPRVVVSAEDAGDEWRIAVADNGPGIPPEDHQRVFALFVRGSGSVGPGLGLGLATCKRIVEGSGGRIGVESPPEGGTRFWFTLSKARPAAPGTIAPAELS